MKKTLPLWIALSLATLAAGAAFAAPAPAAAPQTDLAALHQAIFEPATDAPAQAPGLPPGAQPSTFFCQQGTAYCVYAQCLCTNQCIRLHVPGTLTGCWPDSHTYSCTCQLN